MVVTNLHRDAVGPELEVRLPPHGQRGGVVEVPVDDLFRQGQWSAERLAGGVDVLLHPDQTAMRTTAKPKSNDNDDDNDKNATAKPSQAGPGRAKPCHARERGGKIWQTTKTGEREAGTKEGGELQMRGINTKKNDTDASPMTRRWLTPCLLLLAEAKASEVS